MVIDNSVIHNLGDRPSGYTLDRINNDGNYTPDNLRWADNFTQAANCKRVRRVIQFDLNGDYIATHDSCRAANRAIGKNSGNSAIYSVCSGIGKTAHGYVWRFVG
ncbi:MAG: hypothetical protein N4J56_004624 [Chroococcidiopsis sp. SAG 2025]|nr:hypothetical protein [Chroococcidiopsis sp. SAG 2025]